MRKQFDLNYYLEHPDVKVVTRDGRDARVICTDRKNKQGRPVCVLVTIAFGEEAELDTKANGYLFSNEEESVFDLFFELPEPAKKRVPLTYEDLLERVRSNKTMWFVDDRDTVFNIVDFDFDFVYTITGDAREVVDNTMGELMGGAYMFADGTPFWKEVEEGGKNE